MYMIVSSYSTNLSHADISMDNANDDSQIQIPSHQSRHSKLIPKHKGRLVHVDTLDADALIKIPKLAVNEAVTHIKQPTPDFGHKNVNTPRVFSDLGGSIFSVLFKSASAKPLNHPPEHNQHFMSLIEEIEKYMLQIVAMPTNENALNEDMRKHKKFIQDSMDELDFLEQYFGLLNLPKSAIINFKNLRPVILQLDASGERF